MRYHPDPESPHFASQHNSIDQKLRCMGEIPQINKSHNPKLKNDHVQ